MTPLVGIWIATACGWTTAPYQPSDDPWLISKSSTLNRTTYLVPNGDDLGKSAAITIQGDGVVVDFNGATLRGSAETAEPDKRAGTGIRIVGSNVTIKNAHVHGYKLGLIARDCQGLRILNCDFSYNWKQRLLSTVEREDESDWMSYHHNESEEWLRYGAGIYLSGCKDFEVKGTRITGGQCGLMLTRCERGLAWNNDFSFLSGLGIGMYRSSDNRIMHNHIDWCVRGFSYGVYNRGQDSAGILVFEQCNRNTFAYNSATHGGDGFFLWAGQHTMDTGEGGCDDNLLYGNDFSYSPANGIEATFSRNTFVYNKCLDCWHGVWGGYSYDTKIAGNVFGNADPAIGDEQAIAIEHGQNNVIVHNWFESNHVGAALWGGPVDPNFVYAQKKDTRSRGYKIESNVFHTKGPALDVRVSSELTVHDNRFHPPSNQLRIGKDVGAIDVSGNVDVVPPGVIVSQTTSRPAKIKVLDGDTPLAPSPTSWGPFSAEAANLGLSGIVAALEGGVNAFLKPGAKKGWPYILVDEWGPYDFRSPKLWPRGEAPKDALVPLTWSGAGTTIHKFEVLGPKGKWTLRSIEPACDVYPMSGATGSTMYVRMPAGRATSLKIRLEYTGEATTDYRGIQSPAGKPVIFGYDRFFAPIDWTVKFFKWDAATDPRTHLDAFNKLVQGPAIREIKTDKLDFNPPFVKGEPAVPSDYFADVSEGDFSIRPGTYVLEVTTDDGCRVWVDGEMVIKDAWKYQGPTQYTAELKLGGKHHIRVEHFQIDGYATLKVSLRPKK